MPLLPRPLPGQPWNQCIVNEYLVGQGITWHTDKAYFGEAVACFTLGEAGKMAFRNPKSGGKLQRFPVSERLNFDGVALRPESGSLYLMIGPARHFAEHSMPNLPKTAPPARHQAPAGLFPETVRGRRRVSVTFRYSPG